MVATSRRALPVRRVWLIALAVFAVPGLLQAFETYMFWQIEHEPNSPFWRALLLESVPWMVFAVLTPAIWMLGARLPFRRGHVARALAGHLAGAAMTCALYSLVATTMLCLLAQAESPAFGKTFADWLMGSSPVSALVYACVLGAGYAVSLWSRLRERELHAAKLATQLAESKLSTLRMQLHPHFLFNSLNAILVLVRDRDTAGATRMLSLLGELLRQVLRGDPRHEVSLAEELRFVRRYLAIEQVRFSDRLTVHYEVDDALLDVAVPCFVVQPLVENALRHGIARRAQGGTLEVGARAAGGNVELWVSDDGVGLDAPSAGESSGVGLQNTRARLEQLYGDAGKLDVAPGPAGGVMATIVLPRHAFAGAVLRD